MSKLIDIQNQIDKLQKQAAEIRTKEFSKTIQEIRRLMLAYNISLQDIKAAIESSEGRKRSSRTKPAIKRSSTLAGAKIQPKYRGPNGETWTGRGVMPRWLADLVASGRAKEEFSIQPPEAAAGQA